MRSRNHEIHEDVCIRKKYKTLSPSSTNIVTQNYFGA